MRPNRTPNTASWTWPADFFRAAALSALLLLPAFQAGAAPYVKNASLDVSVDDLADVWLNGVPVVQSLDLTMPGRGRVGPHSIDPCLFKPANLLALRCADNNPTSAMIAFLLRIDLSDGTTRWFSSRETGRIKAYYVGAPGAPEPGGWWMPGFMDRDWTEARSVGAYSTYLSMINEPDAPERPLYLSATDNGGKTLQDGERHLFRAFFDLDAGDNPACGAPTPTWVPPTRTSTPVPTPTWTPSPTPTATYRPPTATKTPLPPRPTDTPRPLPTRTPWILPTRTPWIVPTRTPWIPPTRTPWIVPTRTPTVPPTATATRPRPTATRVPPTSTPTARPPRPTATAPWKKLEPTPTMRYSGNVMVNGPRQWTPPTATATRPRPSAPPTPLPTVTPEAHPEALVFDHLPVAIHVKLADGAGTYTVDLYDASLRPLERLFEKKVAGNLEEWIEWDGKLDGRTAPSGSYLFVCRKGERELKRIWLVLRTGR